MIGSVNSRVHYSAKPPTETAGGGSRAAKTPSLASLKKKWGKSYLCKAAMEGQTLKQALKNLRDSTPPLRLTKKIEAAFRQMILDYSPTYHDNGPEPLALSAAERQGKSNIRPNATEAWVWNQFFVNQGAAFRGNLSYVDSDPTAITANNNIYTRFQICEKWLRANPDILNRLIEKLTD